MAIGIIFVIVGILIAAYPQLLSMIVAAFIILIGITLLSISYHLKKANKETNNPFVDFFIRY